MPTLIGVFVTSKLKHTISHGTNKKDKTVDPEMLPSLPTLVRKSI